MWIAKIKDDVETLMMRNSMIPDTMVIHPKTYKKLNEELIDLAKLGFASHSYKQINGLYIQLKGVRLQILRSKDIPIGRIFYLSITK